MICRKQQLHALVFVAVGREHSVPACCQGWASGQGAGAPQVQHRYKYVQLGKYVCEYSTRNDSEIFTFIMYAGLEATTEALHLSKTGVKPHYLV